MVTKYFADLVEILGYMQSGDVLVIDVMLMRPALEKATAAFN